MSLILPKIQTMLIYDDGLHAGRTYYCLHDQGTRNLSNPSFTDLLSPHKIFSMKTLNKKGSIILCILKLFCIPYCQGNVGYACTALPMCNYVRRYSYFHRKSCQLAVRFSETIKYSLFHSCLPTPAEKTVPWAAGKAVHTTQADVRGLICDGLATSFLNII